MRLLSLGILSLSAAFAATDAELEEQVRKAESAFARSMAERDHRAFASFLAPGAVFFNGPSALRGAEAVAAGWKAFFDGPRAPFSWEPETVVVLADGTLAHSSGPVKDQAGKRIATFNSVWRREANGAWKVVFDKGGPACHCAEPAARP